MILGLCSQILEDRLLPIPLHVVPVINLPMTNRIVHAVAWSFGIRESFVADEEVEVLNPALRCKMTWL